MANTNEHKHRFNPILLTPQNIQTIFDKYESITYVTNTPFNPLPRTEIDPERTKYPSFETIVNALEEARSALDTWDDRKQDWDKAAQYQAEQEIAEAYKNLSPQIRQNDRAMMILTALRADAILQADPSIIDKAFIVEAISYNPHVYNLIPPEYQRDNDIIESFYTANYYGNKNCPEFSQYGIQKDYINCMEHNAPSEQLYTLARYEEAFTAVAREQYGRSASDSELKFLADARTWASKNPELIQEFNNIETKVIEQNLEHISKLGKTINGDSIRENLREFSSLRGTQYPLTEWALEAGTIYELRNLGQDISKLNNDTQKMIEAMYDVGDAIDNFGVDIVSEYIDIDAFYQNIGRKAAELEIESLSNNSPELSAAIDELKSEVAWDKQWQHVGKNICKGYDQHINEHPEFTLNEKGQVIPTPPEGSRPPQPESASQQNVDPSILVFKREGVFEHFNPMAMTKEQIDIIGKAQAEHEKTYVPLKPLTIGPPPKDHTAITDIKLAAEALRNAKDDKEVTDVLTRLSNKIRNSDDMFELIKINPQAYNAVSPFTRNFVPFYKSEAVEANPRVYDFLSEKEQKNSFIAVSYRRGLMLDTTYLDKMQKVLEQSTGKENNIYLPLYDRHPNCAEKLFYGGSHQRFYAKMCSDRDAVLNLSMLGEKSPVLPIHFESSKGPQGLSNTKDVRNIIIPNKGLLLSPSNVALCTSDIKNPYRFSRLSDERKVLSDIRFELGYALSVGPDFYLEYSKAATPSYPVLHLGFDTSKEGKQWRQELKEAIEAKGLPKLQAKLITRRLDRCEHKAKVQMCKNLRRDLSVPERAQRRLDFANQDAVAVEVYPVHPKDVIRVMEEAGPIMLDKYVPPRVQAEYWKVWSQEIATQSIYQSQSPLGLHPQLEHENQVLDKVCEQFPHIAPAIQEGRATAERSVELHRQELEQREHPQKFGFYMGKDAISTTVTKNDHEQNNADRNHSSNDRSL